MAKAVQRDYRTRSDRASGEKMKEHIEKLQKYVVEQGIDAYVVFTNDDHGSEYVVDHFKTRAFLSGFTGSAGTLVVTKDGSYLWTDGRYFLQASTQLKLTDTKLMKMGEPDCPEIAKFIADLADAPTVAFDFKTATVEFVEYLKNVCPSVKLVDDGAIIDSVWTDRPSIECTTAYYLDDKVSGESVASKLANLREDTKRQGCNVALVSSLDDFAWLFNLRGNDIEYNPVNYAYAIVSQTETAVFIDTRKIDDKIAKVFKQNNVKTFEYDQVYEYAKSIKDVVLVDKDKTNYALFSCIESAKETALFPTTSRKACKNPVEIRNIRKAHVEDGVAMVKFMRYLKENVGKVQMSEISLADTLEAFRRESKNFVELSFDTICGYALNGAIVHYSATPETNKQVDKKGLLLVDSGAQYRYGTTDITRTFGLGKLTKEEKRAFTLVLKSHIALACAVFPSGTPGARLDAIAREPMYEYGMDFKHGTGHGVGYLLNVHEGPQNISPRATTWKYALYPGMITSNEPGYYKEGAFGIRHENLVLTVEKEKTEYGTFCAFETITLVPFDLDCIDAKLLSDSEKEWLNSYHKKVRAKLSKHLTGKDLRFLEKATREI